MTVQPLPGFRPDLSARDHALDPAEGGGEVQAFAGMPWLPGWDGRVSLGLLELPRHLRLRWESLSLQDGAEGEAGPFADFAGRLLAFLHFKRVEFPRPCHVEALSFPGPSSEIVLACGSDGSAGAAGCVIVNMGPSVIGIRSCTGGEGEHCHPAGADLGLPAGLGIKIGLPHEVPATVTLVARGAGKVLLLRPVTLGTTRLDENRHEGT